MTKVSLNLVEKDGKEEVMETKNLKYKKIVKEFPGDKTKCLVEKKILDWTEHNFAAEIDRITEVGSGNVVAMWPKFPFKRGDIIYSVNNKVIYDKPFEEVLKVLKEESVHQDATIAVVRSKNREIRCWHWVFNIFLCSIFFAFALISGIFFVPFMLFLSRITGIQSAISKQ